MCEVLRLVEYWCNRVLTALVVGLFAPAVLWAQSSLENPVPGSVQSGIGLISGWVCTAKRVDIEIDGTVTLQAAYGTARGDTVSMCGKADNGFGLLVNWNLLKDGPHTVRALKDGVEFARVSFNVATLGLGDFARGLSGNFTLADFPQAGKSTRIQWQESVQGFVITNTTGTSTGGGSASPGTALENPVPGSFQSGIGLISGWACSATRIDIEIDGSITLQAAYGTVRGDTQSACGDTNNGFGLLVNWNLLKDGTHTLRALRDGVEFARSTFTVATLGLGDFPRGLSGNFTLSDFPQAGTNVSLRWEESLQNFTIACVGHSAADGSVCQGLNALSTGNLNAANAAFTQGVEADPNNARANLYLSLTRIALKALSDPQLASLTSRSGVVITGNSNDVCGLHVSFPQTILANAPRTGEIFDTLSSVLGPEITAALDNLNHLSDSVDVVFDPNVLPVCLRPATRGPTVEIDRGDTLGLVGLLQAVQTAFSLVAAYNFDVDLQTAVNGTGQQILSSSPSLFTLKSGDALGVARRFADQSLANLSSAIASILAETDDQSNDLIMITPQDRKDAEHIKQALDLVRQSLTAQVVLPTDIGLPAPERLNLSLFFSGTFNTLRPFVPTFNDQGNFNFGQFPDPTFGGTTPDLTQQAINLLVGVFPKKAGICVGVTVYELANFAGQSKTFTSNVPDLSLISGPCGGSFNNCISSIKVPAGCEADGFESTNFSGQIKYFTSDVPDLSAVSGSCAGGSFNDCISSLYVYHVY